MEEGVPLSHRLNAQSRARLLCCMGDLVAEENPNDAPRLFAYQVSEDDVAACRAAGDRLVARERDEHGGAESADALDLSFESVVGESFDQEQDADASAGARNCLYYYRRAWVVSKGRFARAMRALGWIHFNGQKEEHRSLPR